MNNFNFTFNLTLILSLSIPKLGYSIACGTEMHISIINEQDLLKNMATINQKTWTCEGWVLAGKWPKRLKGLFNPLVHWTSTCLERFQCPEDIGKFLVKNYLYLQNLHQQSWTPMWLSNFAYCMCDHVLTPAAADWLRNISDDKSTF